MASTISANSTGGGGLVNSGDASGVLILQTNGVTALTIDTSQVVTFANPPTTAIPITSLTALTAPFTPNTNLSFTGIPNWVKRITVLLSGISTASSGIISISAGNGGYESTGYHGTMNTLGVGGATYNTQTETWNLLVGYAASGLNIYTGQFVITKLVGNTYSINGTMSIDSNGTSTYTVIGSKTFTGIIDRVQLIMGPTYASSGDTFDAGSINVMYE